MPSPLPNAFLVADYMAKAYLAYGPSDNSTIALRVLAATSNLLGGVTASTTATDLQRRLGLLMAAVVSLPEFQVT
jgi:hypothetical protein